MISYFFADHVAWRYRSVDDIYGVHWQCDVGRSWFEFSSARVKR